MKEVAFGQGRLSIRTMRVLKVKAYSPQSEPDHLLVSAPSLFSSIFLYYNIITWYAMGQTCQCCFFLHKPSFSSSIFSNFIFRARIENQNTVWQHHVDFTIRCRRQPPWVTSGTHYNPAASSLNPSLKFHHNSYNTLTNFFSFPSKCKCPEER